MAAPALLALPSRYSCLSNRLLTPTRNFRFRLTS
ncbi:Uncharacterised protein [Bordetella pertussis]|nr:Uncharacterised protein [Bordetella pertussis]